MPKADRPAAAESAPDATLRVAARVLRAHGLSGATLAQVAEALGCPVADLTARYATKDLLVQAVLAEALRIVKAADRRDWHGYGTGMRRTLNAVRSFEDGYILLVRDAPLHPLHRPTWEALRRRTGQRLRALIWRPDDPPPAAGRPPLTELTVAPMVSFCIDAISQWVETGDPAQDELFLRWCAQMMRAWWHSTCELLNLDTPDPDWPFEADISAPVRGHARQL